jgi:hypothetical protein
MKTVLHVNEESQNLVNVTNITSISFFPVIAKHMSEDCGHHAKPVKSESPSNELRVCFAGILVKRVIKCPQNCS